jgi:multisubunit Na+/H+ antiporter MnhB subunit
MRSLLLEQLARLIVPLSLILGAALLVKGHDEPGGGFVAGLSLAMASVLALAAFGRRASRLRIVPEVIALSGVALILLSMVLPLFGGDPMLTHASGVLPLVGKWHAALLFDIGVTLAVGAGAAAAARHLWAAEISRRRGRGGEG